MRNMPSSELVSLISFLAVLLIFFSIDVRSRVGDEEDPWHIRLFAWTSRLGAVTTALALAFGWIDLFLSDELNLIHVGLVAVPGSVAITRNINRTQQALIASAKDKTLTLRGHVS